MTETTVIGTCKACGLDVYRDHEGDILHVAYPEEFEKVAGPHTPELVGESTEPHDGWKVSITYEDGTTEKTTAAGVAHLPAALAPFAGSPHGNMVRIVCK